MLVLAAALQFLRLPPVVSHIFPTRLSLLHELEFLEHLQFPRSQSWYLYASPQANLHASYYPALSLVSPQPVTHATLRMHLHSETTLPQETCASRLHSDQVCRIPQPQLYLCQGATPTLMKQAWFLPLSKEPCLCLLRPPVTPVPSHASLSHHEILSITLCTLQAQAQLSALQTSHLVVLCAAMPINLPPALTAPHAPQLDACD